MSIFETLSPTIAPKLKEWIHDMNALGEKGKMILLNFFEEQRLPHAKTLRFCDDTVKNIYSGLDPISSYTRSIAENSLFL